MPTPIALVHGGLGSAKQLQPLRHAVRAAYPAHAVRVYELPGHGHTPLADDAHFSIAHFANTLGDDITNDAADAGDKPVLFGYSMGGYIGMLLELLRPNSVSGIITLGTKFEWNAEVAEVAARRMNAGSIRHKVPAFAAALEVRHAHAGGWLKVLERSASVLRALGREPLVNNADLARLQLPVELLVGSRDDTVSYDETARIAALLPEGRATLLHDLPHPLERVPSVLIVQALGSLLTR